MEYKFQPVFDGCADLTISCAEIDILPPPTVGGGTSCLAQTFEIALANEVTTEPTDCNSPYVGTVVRTFQATDGNGNTASCEQNIQLERIDFTKLEFPQGTTTCLLYTSPSPRDATLSRMPSSA